MHSLPASTIGARASLLIALPTLFACQDKTLAPEVRPEVTTPSSAAATDASQYQLVRLPSLGGTFSEAVAINAAGDIIGVSDGRPTLWPGNGGPPRQLESFDDGRSGTPTSINDRGDVVGYSDRGAIIWIGGGPPRELPPFGDGSSGIPTGINDRGDVVGYTNTSNGRRGVLWPAGGAPRQLSTLGGVDAFAQGINNSGDIVGWSHISGVELTPHGALWSTHTETIRDLGGSAAGGTKSEALRVNSRGDVIGFSFTPDPEAHATIWPAHGEPRDLGTLGGDRSNARDLNEKNDIVGWASTPFNHAHHAVIWPGGEGIVDLGNLVEGADQNGGPRSEALAINSAGNIVGWAENTAGGRDAVIWEKRSS